MKRINFNFRLLILIGVLIMSVPQVFGDANPSYFGTSFCTMDITYNNGSGSTTLTQNDGAYKDLGTVSAFQWNNYSFRMCRESGGNVGQLCSDAYCHYSDGLAGAAASWTDAQQTNITWKYGGNDNNVQYEGTMNMNMLAEKGGGIYELHYCFCAMGSYYYAGDCGTSYWKPGGTDYYNFRYTINPTDVSDFTVEASGQLSGSGTEDDPYIMPHNGTLVLTSSDATKSNTYDERATIQYSIDNSTWGTTSEYYTKTISSITVTGLTSVDLYARYHITDADGNGTEDDELTGAVKTKTIYYKTSPWSIAGTMNSTGWNMNTYLIHHYDENGIGYVNINLPANTDIEFKVKNRTNEEWYSENTTLTFTNDDGEAHNFDKNESNNCTITTGAAGDYTFTWDGVNHKLTVTYPKPTYDIAYYDQGSSAFTGTQADPPTTHTYGTATNLVIPTRVGYNFAGWFTASDCASGQVGNTTSATLGATDYVADINLYAKWTEVALTSAAAGNWNSTATWSPACVPTKGHDVTIAHAVSVSDARVAKTVTINQSTGSLTIASTGTLDVIGTISNANEDRLEVMAGGALIFDYSGAPAATVHHSVSGGTFRYIALPIGYVHVSSAFADEGVYTWVWHEGSGWERRGYYDDISANEPIAIKGQSSWTFYGTLVNALFGSVANTTGDYAGTNMYANSWTAPIRISGVTISGNADQVVYTDNSGSWYANTANGTGSAVVPAMSSFVILANGAGGGSVSIPYNTAVRNVAVSSPASAPRRVASDDIQNHITINITGNELKTNLRLYENEVFTNEFDNGWEARFLEGDGRAGQLYTQTDDKMVILATPDLEGTVVGLIPGEATDYTISFEGDGKGYYLNDVKTGESTLIDEANTYNFKSDETTNATRFVISKMPMQPTGVDEVADGSKARKQMIDGTLYIIRDGRIYTVTGNVVK